MNPYMTCGECITYAESRIGVLVIAMAERRRETGETAAQITDRYMNGVHQRHLSGLSLAVTA